MKKKIEILFLLIFIIFFYNSCAQKNKNLKFIVYKNYFYSGKKFNKNKFIIMKNEKEFNLNFHASAVMKNQKWIDNKIFKNNIIIAIVKTGNNYYKFKINQIYIKNNKVNIDYNSKLISKNMSWYGNFLILFSVKKNKSNIDQYYFFENSKLIKK